LPRTSTRRRILVVEDEALVAADLEARLEALGFNVCGIADTCDDAIADARAMQPDLVLMDINLIGPRDGIEAAVEIRRSCGIPIIFITAYADDATLARIGPSDPFGYIVKPFAERDLRVAIEVAFFRKQAEVQRSAMESWLSSTLSSIGDGVIATDLDHKIQFINPIAAGMTGWVRGAALGRHITEVFALRKDGKDISASHLLDLAFSKRATTHLEDGHSLVLRDGRSLPVADSIALIRDDRETITGWVINFRGVTALFATEPEPTLSEVALMTSGWKGSGPALLVDDEPTVRTACGLLLKHLGFDVELAENGRKALAMVRMNQGHYRFVCMDMMMPEMSGREAFKTIREEFPALPIILMSGYAESPDGVIFDEEQPTAILLKPFSKQDLTDLLARILI
jgi:PAS domain S-box-containing protein